jgi:hypothetical protein
MRTLSVIAAMLIAAPLSGADLDPQILLELAKAKRLREAKSSPTVKQTSTCNCGITGKCQCWADECRCAACGLGGAAAGPKPTGSPTTGATPARSAATHQGPEREPGSSAATPGVASTSTSAPFALPGGGTNCPNGQCPSATTYQRRGLIFWR